MTRAAIPVRALGALSAGLLTLGILVACTPQPAPKPTKTQLFSSDAEAFKAAEETYRAYNDAGNARRNGLDDPDPQDYLSGRALKGDIDGVRALKSAGLTTTGEAVVVKFVPINRSVKNGGHELSAVVCLDASEIRTVNSDDVDVTPADRPAVLAQRVRMKWVDTEYVITDEMDEDNQTCAG